MQYRLKNCSWILAFMLVSVMYSCSKDKDDIYTRPSWLKGNAWEVLSSRNDMSIFQRAIEKSGYKDLVNGSGIVTVMAPTNEALQKYLQAKSYTSIEDMPIKELKKLVGFHLVYYSFTKEQFSNYQPDGQDNQSSAFMGLYYKFRTKSKDTIEKVLDVASQRYKDVIHKERFLPVFSTNLFTTKNITAKYNYEYFYPSSTWSGDGFNVSNASVAEYAIPTDNGYLYVVNQVVEPLETIYAELKKESDYSTFVSLYDRFATFWYDASSTKQYAATGDSLYVYKHTSLPLIASEWSYNGESTLADYANLAELSGKAFNVFAPSNTALDAFFKSFWDGYGYASLKDVDYLPIAYLLYNHVYQGSVVFPEEITKGSIKSSFGNVIKFDPAADVSVKKMCSNGTFYGLNKVIVPDMFKSITAPVFRNPSYKIFLYMLSSVGMIEPLSSDAIQNTIFIPSDDVILNTIYQGSNIYWTEGNPNVFGDEVIQVEDATGNKSAMNTSAMTKFVNNHIVTEKITEIAGKKVYRTRNSFSYIYVTDAGVASSGTYNNSTFVKATNIPGSWTNGTAYEVNASLLKEEGSFKYLIGAATSATSSLTSYSEFSKLLATAGLITTNNELSFLLGDNFVLFAPSNAAIIAAKAQNLIPTGTAALAEYLKKYFVPVSTNSLTDYPFIGSGIQGVLSTAQASGSPKITLIDNGTNLKVANSTGKTATVTTEFPRIYSDGAIYMIDSVL